MIAPLTCTTEALVIVYGFRGWPGAQLACIVPLGLLASNTVKDVLMLSIVKTSPHESTAVVRYTSITNMIKTVLVGLSLSLVLAATGSIIARFLRQHTSRVANV